MNVVVDTSVWSLVLRRRRVDEAQPWVRAFRAVVESGHAILLFGPILQELLDGVRTPRDFNRLLRLLAPFPLIPPDRETYVLAARLSSRCRAKGIRAGSVDFLIAAGCVQGGYPLLTADRDFRRIATCCELTLMEAPQRS